MSNKKPSKSFEITLSAVSCAVAVVFLYLGTFNSYILATGYLMAEIALMLPLAKNFYVGDGLAYVGTCILTLILGALAKVWVLVPFIMFFGLHPLVNALQLRFKINRWLALIVKALWFDGTILVAYYFIFGATVGDVNLEIFQIVNKYIIAFVAVFGSLFFWLYDYLMFKCQMTVNMLVYRIKK